ncbi:glycosyltransferase [Bosea beijingensis]|uniref:glycosyltransferase n=1 Tax=Bosea beijingensis TaxID=3068632 RepID=UPI0027415F0F|nr:glycosyltransferase [Bosea sp. REN20]
MRRQGDAFADAGWLVTAVGLDGGASPAPSWTILTPGSASPGRGPQGAASAGPAGARALAARLPGALRRIAQPCWRLALRVLKLPEYARLASFRLAPGQAVDYYLRRPHIAPLYAAALDVKAAVYLANDWHMLPVAMALAERHGGIVGYDTHEYALEEYGHRLAWKLTRVPLVRAVEGAGLARAKVRTAVSAGIGTDIARIYGLPEPLQEIRNVPDRHDVPFRAVGSRCSVLFHGILAPNRGIEECLESVPLWRPEFEFVLRGPGERSYLDMIEQTIDRLKIRDRVRLDPPVPMVELVARATEADIGIVTLPPSSKHNLYALPNKFFEYVQAGLALIVSDLPDMRALVDRHGFGVLTESLTPEAIAAAVNGLDAAGIDRLKQRSLAAAGELNWDVERSRLVGLYETAISRA